MGRNPRPAGGTDPEPGNTPCASSGRNSGDRRHRLLSRFLTTSGRFVFTIPQFDDLVYIGLTDVPAPGPIPDATTRRGQVDWILDVFNRSLNKAVTRADVIGSFAGLRPLAANPAEGARDRDISRHHLITGGPGEVITVTGGKLTTYRRMAQDAVDKISDVKCQTQRIALVGAGATLIDQQSPTAS